jgi:hypothetical protein
MTAHARCRSCEWTADGDWPSVDAADGKHSTTAQHATYTMVTVT